MIRFSLDSIDWQLPFLFLFLFFDFSSVRRACVIYCTSINLAVDCLARNWERDSERCYESQYEEGLPTRYHGDDDAPTASSRLISLLFTIEYSQADVL